MAHRALRDPEQEGWERADMPIVCETCLGPNPFVRMQRIEYGGLCHISNRPYTVFRWRPGADARYKKTIVCQEVAKAKNVCQVCLLDLEYNLPVQVRDTALGLTNEDEPQSDVGKEFQLHQRVKEGEDGSSFAEGKPNDLLQRLQRTTPWYKRNMARVCTFFARGLCTRGAECPYRHEMPTTGELANQNIKDRYYGINDPVANKMLRRVGEMPSLDPPADPTVTTLFVGGVTPDISDDDLRDHFYAFGELASIRKVESRGCAFITYTTRGGAEKAASELFGKLVIKGQRLRLAWGKPQAERTAPPPVDPMLPSGSAAGMLPPQVAAASGMLQPAPPGPDPFNLSQANYPSMAKDAMGTRIPAPGDLLASAKRQADSAPDTGAQPSSSSTTTGYGAAPGQDAAKRMRPLPGFGMGPPGFMGPPGYPMGPPPGYGRPAAYGMGPPGFMPPPQMRPPQPAMGMPPPQQQQQPVASTQPAQ